MLSDAIAIIYKGQILMVGTLEELKGKILGINEYEAKFSTAWSATNLKLPQGVILTGQGKLTLRFSVENPKESNPLLLNQLSSLRAPLLAFQEIPHSLEEVYLKVMADAQKPHGEGSYEG